MTISAVLGLLILCWLFSGRGVDARPKPRPPEPDIYPIPSLGLFDEDGAPYEDWLEIERRVASGYYTRAEADRRLEEVRRKLRRLRDGG